MRRHWPQKCQDLLWFAYHYTLKSILLTNFQALLVSYAKFNNFYLLLIQMIESGHWFQQKATRVWNQIEKTEIYLKTWYIHVFGDLLPASTFEGCTAIWPFEVGVDAMCRCWCKYMNWLAWVPWGVCLGWLSCSSGVSLLVESKCPITCWWIVSVSARLAAVSSSLVISADSTCATVSSFRAYCSGCNGIGASSTLIPETEVNGDSWKDVSRCISNVEAPDDSDWLVASLRAGSSEAFTVVDVSPEWSSPEEISLRGVSKISEQ